MNWRGHVLFGLVLYAILAYLCHISLTTIIILGPLAMFSAILPDIDLKQSKARAIMDIFAVLLAIFYPLAYMYKLNLLKYIQVGWISSAAFIGLYFIAVRFFMPKHRGFTHTIAATLIYAILIYTVFGWLEGCTALIGYSSHLLADKHIRLV